MSTSPQGAGARGWRPRALADLPLLQMIDENNGDR